MSTPLKDSAFVIASLKHTHNYHEHITFWGPDHCGYRMVVLDGHVGEYSLDAAQSLNDGADCIAVPVDAVKALLSPCPFYASNGRARPFYDTPGPVVDNTRANWSRLIAASLPRTGGGKPKPEVLRGKRRSFAMPEATGEAA